MKVYVAGRWTRRAEAKGVMRALQDLGHSITHDWTVKEDNPGMTPDALDEYYELCAAADVDGVLDADVFLLLHDDGCRGAFVELGVAIAHGCRIVVVGGETHPDPVSRVPIFYWLPEVEHFPDAPQAIASIDRTDREAA